MLKRFLQILLIPLIVYSTFATASNQLIFSDDFDGNNLDEWDGPIFDKFPTYPSSGWDYELVNSGITVNDIFTDDLSGTLTWRVISLSRKVPPLSDFEISWQVSWENLTTDINHRVSVQLRDKDGGIISYIEYFDAWPNAVGAPYWAPCAAEGACNVVFGAAGTIGTANIVMSRVGNDVTFSWSSTNGYVISETVSLDPHPSCCPPPEWSNEAVEEVLVSFHHFDKFNTGTGSIVPFGKVAMEAITVEGTIENAMNHFTIYDVKPEPFIGVDGKEGDEIEAVVTMGDQFGSSLQTVKEAKFLLVPSDKNAEGIPDEESHLTCYDVKGDPDVKPDQSVIIENQFTPDVGIQSMTVNKLKQLCLPSTKAIVPDVPEESANGEHFACYDAKPDDLEGKTGKGADELNIQVTLDDQFGSSSQTVTKAEQVCLPSSIDGQPAENTDNHLVCYQLKNHDIDVEVKNEFSDLVGPQLMAVQVGSAARGLCVPSTLQLN